MKASLYLRNKREAKGKGARRDESASALEDYLQGQGMDEVAARRCRLRLDAMANDGKSPMEIEAVLRAEIKEFKALAELLEGEPDHEGFAGADRQSGIPRSPGTVRPEAAEEQPAGWDANSGLRHRR